MRLQREGRKEKVSLFKNNKFAQVSEKEEQEGERVRGKGHSLA